MAPARRGHHRRRLAFVPTHHASASFVFTKFVNLSGFHSVIYVFFIGLLMAQYTFTGYDASAHMSEETHQPRHGRRPRGSSAPSSSPSIAGWILILAITFVIPTNSKVYATTAVQEFAPVLIWTAAVGRTRPSSC